MVDPQPNETAPVHPLVHYLDGSHDRAEVIKTALSRNSMLHGRNVHFEFEEQDLVLQGVVRSYYEKQVAQEVLRGIDGIRRIRNEIQVNR